MSETDYSPAGIYVAAIKAGYPESAAHDLADLVRGARAEAWDEGLGAGADRWMDAREFGDPPVNPYREVR